MKTFSLRSLSAFALASWLGAASHANTPPQINTFSVTPASVYRGDTVLVNLAASDADANMNAYAIRHIGFGGINPGGVGAPPPNNASFNLSFSYTIPSAAPFGNNPFRAEVGDTQSIPGNASTYGIQELLVNVGNRAPAVSITGPTELSVGESAIYTISVSDADGNLAQYRVHFDELVQWASATGSSAETSRTLIFANPGTYTLAAEAEDSLGATTTGSLVVQVTPRPIPVFTGPTTLPLGVFDNFAASVTDPDGNLVRWRVRFASNPNAKWTPLSGGSARINFSFAFTTTGQHTWIVEAEDADQNVASTTLTVDVVAGPGTLTAPLGLSASDVTPTSFTFNWSALHPATGVTSYEVQRDGLSLGRVSGTSLHVSGLSNGVPVAMTVRAVDAAGNTSPWSAALNVTPAAAPVAAAFYVSPNGNDNNAGTFAFPLRTIAGAQARVRSALATANGNIVVYLRGGRYPLTQTLSFTPEDARPGPYTVTYQNYGNERPVISGGVTLSGWQSIGNNTYRTTYNGPVFRQLYVNGTRRTRARFPNEGIYRRTYAADKPNGAVLVRTADAPSNLSTLLGAELVLKKNHQQSRLRIASTSPGPLTVPDQQPTTAITPMEPERSVEVTTWGPPGDPGTFTFVPGDTYYFEGALAFLDAAGEWFYDANTHYLYYRRRSGESLFNLNAVVPALETLLEIKGATDADGLPIPGGEVRNLKFVGLTFEHSNWNEPSFAGHVSVQAGAYQPSGTTYLQGMRVIPSAIKIHAAANVVLQGNVFRHLGAGGMELTTGTNHLRIVGNNFWDIAAHGLTIPSMTGQPHTSLMCYGDEITDNRFTQIAQDYTECVGIYVTFARGVNIQHNEVYDLPYSGISVGWGWSPALTMARDQQIRHNRVWNALTFHDDGGGIYVMSNQPNSEITDNHVTDIHMPAWVNPAAMRDVVCLYFDNYSNGYYSDGNYFQNYDLADHISGDAGPDNIIVQDYNTPPSIPAGPRLPIPAP